MSTFLSSSPTCPATQSGRYQPTCRLDVKVGRGGFNVGLPMFALWQYRGLFAGAVVAKYSVESSLCLFSLLVVRFTICELSRNATRPAGRCAENEISNIRIT